MNKNNYDVIIVGGGLAGLVASILLSRQQKKVLLLEKNGYPFHKVCGEYVSNEVLPFLQSIGFNPFEHGAAAISRLRISTPSGKNIVANLDVGGFGLSRYTMDEALFHLAVKNGSTVLTGMRVSEIIFNDQLFNVKTYSDDAFFSPIVIGSYGKRDTLDKKLNRDFIQSKTGYMGVKYHIKTDYPKQEVGLDNFNGGYCGIVKIENSQYNLCYLYQRNKDVSFSSIPELEQEVLYKNPVIKNIFSSSEFIYKEPEVINEISFSRKPLIENHILMCGDSAGLITPLCGNGMSIAIRSAKLLCDLLISSGLLNHQPITAVNRAKMEQNYQQLWNSQFRRQLFLGRSLQQFFGNAMVSEWGLRTIHSIPSLERYLISSTHGSQL